MTECKFVQVVCLLVAALSSLIALSPESWETPLVVVLTLMAVSACVAAASAKFQIKQLEQRERAIQRHV